MAERRMFAKTIIDSDAFIDMPMSARLLYYDLGMRADDDGFVNSPKKIMKFSGASDDDFRILSAKKFIIPFESGVVVIKHWKIHNYIRKDTYTETKYKCEKAMLYTDENNAYSTTNPLLNSGEETPSTIRGRAVDEPLTQVRLGKDSLVKDSLSKDSQAILCEPLENSAESKNEEVFGRADSESKDTIRSKNSNPARDVIESVIDECLLYLNTVSGKSFKITTESNRKFVRARINEDYTMDDFKRVIDNQWLRWKDSDMVEYMRPSTLFNAEKFQSYINAPDYSKVKPKPTGEPKGGVTRITPDFFTKLAKEHKQNDT